VIALPFCRGRYLGGPCCSAAQTSTPYISPPPSMGGECRVPPACRMRTSEGVTSAKPTRPKPGGGLRASRSVPPRRRAVQLGHRSPDPAEAGARVRV